MSDAGITVRYVYSACIVTTTKEATILHDPWFSEGIYDGAWFHYPPVRDPIASIGDVDLIYVSHIHPDHYDRDFVRQYFAVYGSKELLIADHSPNHLAAKMTADGFQPTILKNQRTIGATTIEILPHKTGSNFDIDSAIVVKYLDGREHCVVNANDIVFDDCMIAKLKAIAGPVDVLLCGYTGAGPYPQTYFDVHDPFLAVAAENKRQGFFSRYRKLISAIDAKVNIPFAGQYVLGGRLTDLNNYRGIADATEVLAFDPHAIVLDDNNGEISTADLRPTAIRTQPYPASDIQTYLQELRSYEMDYERLISQKEIYQLPIKRLLIAAARRANKESECEADYFFTFRLPSNEIAVLNANRLAPPMPTFVAVGTPLPLPRSEIDIDPRYLFGLLANIYHWNNAEVGSQYRTHRIPDSFNEKAQAFLTYLRV